MLAMFHHEMKFMEFVRKNKIKLALQNVLENNFFEALNLFSLPHRARA